MNLLFDRIPYWPEHIISQLTVGKPRYIYFRDEEHTHITPVLQELFKKELPIDMVHVVGWDKLDDALMRYTPVALAFNIRTLSYNANLTLQEIISMIRSQMKIVNTDIPLVVGINKDTPQSIIKQLKKEGIHSICPTIEFGIDEIRKAIQSILDGVPHWPRHIIDQLPRAAKKKVTPGKITLTMRQSQILKLIKERGAPNKVIANALNISESTVKLHVGCILKKYALTNRTQLVVLDLKDHVA
jgi:DNA-binding NarL/FixJ family response regulator